MKYILILFLLTGCGGIKQRVVELGGAQCGNDPKVYQEYDVNCKDKKGDKTCVYTIACKRVK